MMIKLIALGNVLMEDDGAAICLAKMLEDQLQELDIEVVYGETDIDYCISSVTQDDFLILLDAAGFEVPLGEIRRMPLKQLFYHYHDYSPHGLSFIHLCRLFYPQTDGEILIVGIAKAELHYGVSPQFQDKVSEISQELLKQITHILQQVNL